MSATINASLFAGYFATIPRSPAVASAPALVAAADGAARINAPTLHIPGFTHPVSEYWLEDVLAIHLKAPYRDTITEFRRT